MGLAALRAPDVASGTTTKPRERIAVRLGLLFAALVAVIAGVMAAVVWSLWPEEAERSIGAVLAVLVPVLAGSAFVVGQAFGLRMERRLAQLAAGSPFPTMPEASDWWRDPLGLDGALASVARRFEAALRDTELRGQALISDVERVAQLGRAERNLTTDIGIWSDEFHSILGLVPGSCVPSHAVFLDVVHPGDRAEVDAILRAVCAEGGYREADFRIIRSDGEVRMIHGRAEVVCDVSGTPLRLNSTIQDVTERKRLENELDGLIRELWRSNEELEQFAYVASHDLRQPLRVVGSYVSLLEDELMGSLGGDAREYMGFVRDGVRRMDRLITDLLAYSRVGRVIGDAPFPAEGAVRSALVDLQIEMEDSGAQILVPADLPVLNGDKGEMERLFLNLIGNALKYRRPDQAPVVQVECEDAGADWLFRVRDNGIGIPPEHAERVFGIFQRLHARDEYEGTGVGLAIVKKIVERHGGTIRVEPREGPGAVVAFSWPKAGHVAEVDPDLDLDLDLGRDAGVEA